MISPFELEENYLLSWSEFKDNSKSMKDSTRLKIENLKNDPVPTAYGFHPELGWFVLVCGQGPFLAFSENKNG